MELKTRWENVILFGAGASNGVGGSEPPPLGPDLYDLLANEFTDIWGLPEVDELFPRLDSGGRDFELGMAQLMEPRQGPQDPGHDLAPLLRTFGELFTRYMPPDTGDPYTALLELMVENDALDRTLFASLNYDCLFEEAAHRLGLSVTYSLIPSTEPELDWDHRRHRSPARGKVVRIWKLHGSCNFFAGGTQTFAGNSFYGGIGGMSPPLACDSLDVARRRYTPTHLGLEIDFPAIAVYAPSKPYSMSARRFFPYLKAWDIAVRLARRVIVIGVAAPSERSIRIDKHIWNPIIETAATVYLVSGRARFRGFTNLYRHEGTESLGERFTALPNNASVIDDVSKAVWDG